MTTLDLTLVQIVARGGDVYGFYIDEPLALINSGGTFFYADNRVYSPAALTDSSGIAQERYRYDSYGNRTIFAADDTTARTLSSYGNQRGFTGYYEDLESVLDYARERMYSSVLGVFIQREPICMQETRSLLRDIDAEDGRVGVPGSLMGYQKGLSLYSGYFVPEYNDLFGVASPIPPERCTIVVWVGHSGDSDNGGDSVAKRYVEQLKARKTRLAPTDDPKRPQDEINTFRIVLVCCKGNRVNGIISASFPNNEIPNMPSMPGFGFYVPPGQTLQQQQNYQKGDYNMAEKVTESLNAAHNESAEPCPCCKKVTIKVHCADSYPGHAAPQLVTDKGNQQATLACDGITSPGTTPEAAWGTATWTDSK